ncbi:methionyl-tRNA formyltransferase [Frigoribacterium sp. CFBP 13729]|uniref:methionyl-tRNA formyltransferase n=1 Tax=unclassified Frigoribacterium TaxID=2627005 RepID=UPI001780FCEF|nr:MULTISPECIES: methionyl-tRNA formyltransferase [unclassified Frigoribacterium]MBD8584439.1 methionyl-tRNA formyltransferase [Frigoribacterium sp. CFBP 8766]MBD8609198.1 methionyl-tRNA formyltransferase [Frigoribacterium sp. CFBP 13729]
MRLVFAGSPSAAVPSLTALAASEHEVVAVVTRDDTPQGRRRVLTATPVALEAERLGLPVVKTRRITDEVAERIAALDADLGVVVAFGALLREPVLSAPRLGWVNLHFSLLPRWRGAAPVQRSLMAGDDRTGAVVFQLVPELDAGDLLGALERPLDGTETAGALLDELAATGADLLGDVVDRLAAGTAEAVAQVGEVTLAPKLVLDDGALDLTLPATQVVDRWRGTTPEPGAHLPLGDARLKVLELRAVDAGAGADDAAGAAAEGEPLAPGRISLRGRRLLVGTGTAPLELVRVQPPGKKPMAGADWSRGLPSLDDVLLTPPAATTGDDTTTTTTTTDEEAPA